MLHAGSGTRAPGRGLMKFTSTHARAFMGNDISVEVDADAKESIRSVAVILDGWSLEAVDLGPGTSQYQRDFRGVGDTASGMPHTLIVSAADQDLNLHSSETKWTDA